MAERTITGETVRSVSWLKLPIVGMPGTECGRKLVAGGLTESVGVRFEHEAASRWLFNSIFLCQEHAAEVAAACGDDIAAIETAWREEQLERCNGCGRPRSEWGPVCPGMTQGDWTHFHSAEFWKARRDAT